MKSGTRARNSQSGCKGKFTVTGRPLSPNIDDIINPAEFRAAKTGQKINPDIAASGSIDDLLRVLEAEKKKL